jgi:diguanylate cyclase (GGDEF)-like protein
MADRDPLAADDHPGSVQDDLRLQVANLLLERSDAIVADAITIFPYNEVEPLDADCCRRVARQLVQLLALSVREGRVDSRARLVVDLHDVMLDRSVSVDRLFTFAYLIERIALDELVLHERLGATNQSWPVVAQLVRRGSFDYLAAYTRTRSEPGEAPITDVLTTLHTRRLFDAVLVKEIERASRFGYPISLILLDVDRFSAINQEQGVGVGDRVLQRLGILVRNYFRQHDWVARHADDSIVVLLSRTEADRATELTEGVRSMVEERLAFDDRRTEQPGAVTVSAAIVNVTVQVGDIIDPERLLAVAEAAVQRAKEQGRNRVERVDGYSGPATRLTS